jgi:hypothetical protein
MPGLAGLAAVQRNNCAFGRDEHSRHATVPLLHWATRNRRPEPGADSGFVTGDAQWATYASATERCSASPSAGHSYATVSLTTPRRAGRSLSSLNCVSARCCNGDEAATPSVALAWPQLSDSGRAEQQPGHRHRGSFAVQAVAFAPVEPAFVSRGGDPRSQPPVRTPGVPHRAARTPRVPARVPAALARRLPEARSRSSRQQR